MCLSGRIHSPYDIPLQVGLVVVHQVLRDLPQRDWQGHQHENAAREPRGDLGRVAVLLELDRAQGEDDQDDEAVRHHDYGANPHPPSPHQPSGAHVLSIDFRMPDRAFTHIN